ncbi:MAG: WD40 repeat domain-containing protein [Pirellulaceae bacterium]
MSISKTQPYQIAFSRIDQHGVEVPEKIIFDTEKLQLRTAEELTVDEWSSGQSFSQGWEIRTESNQQAEQSFWTYHNDQRKAKLPIDVRSQGQVVPASACWLSSDQRQPFAVAVGLNGSNNILVFRLQDQGVCPVIRQFRGHTAEVRSIAASLDGRILISSADDGTVRAWPLIELDTLPPIINRWGATFQMVNDQLVVDQIREDGPLYFKGIRQGDVVRIRYYENQAMHSVPANESLAKLLDSDWNEMLEFEYVRGDAPARSFLLFPAWQQLATLFVDQNRQWAFWSPAGYYDASLEGNDLFGWQVNRGRSESPDSFLAARFREALEKPRVMSQLLTTGSLDAAFRKSGQDVPARTDQTILDQYRLKPAIHILPINNDPADALRIVADISVPQGETLLPPKAFANGVVATNAALLESTESDGRTVYKYQWDANLPTDKRILFQVVASTQSKIIDVQERLFEQERLPNRRSPRLFVSTVGIDRYRDSQIQRLDFAVNNATQVAKVLESLCAPVYRQETSVALVNEQANRQSWKNVIRSQLQKLKTEVSPDDLFCHFSVRTWPARSCEW